MKCLHCLCVCVLIEQVRGLIALFVVLLAKQVRGLVTLLVYVFFMYGLLARDTACTL